MTTTKAEPRFDIDLKYGKKGELQISELLEAIVSGNGKVEVKTKRILDLEFFIETHCDKGRTGNYQPSGINVTTADTWAFCLGESGIAVTIPTSLLREGIENPSAQPKSEIDGSCPTKGMLVNLGVLLYLLRKKLEVKPEPPTSIEDKLREIGHVVFGLRR